MPKPKNKKELIEACVEEQDRLFSFLDSLSEQQLHADFRDPGLNQNVRDVLGHLHHWHLLFLNWYKIGMNSEKPPMPSEGFNWQQIPQLNQKIHKIYLDSDLTKVRKLQSKSHQQILEILRTHSDEELFTKKMYKWTGSTSMAVYAIANTSSHYKWACKLIKKKIIPTSF